MDLIELVKQAHSMARTKGFWDGQMRMSGPPSAEVLGAKLALIHSEVSEALECVRDGDMRGHLAADPEGKPEGLPYELADVVVRVADLCGALGIDLDEAVRTKMAFNATRQHRHGGRRL